GRNANSAPERRNLKAAKLSFRRRTSREMIAARLRRRQLDKRVGDSGMPIGEPRLPDRTMRPARSPPSETPRSGAERTLAAPQALVIPQAICLETDSDVKILLWPPATLAQARRDLVKLVKGTPREGGHAWERGGVGV